MPPGCDETLLLARDRRTGRPSRRVAFAGRLSHRASLADGRTAIEGYLGWPAGSASGRPDAPGADLCPMSSGFARGRYGGARAQQWRSRPARGGADTCRDSTRSGEERLPDGHDAARAGFSGARFAGREPVQAPALRPAWQHATRRLIAVTSRNESPSSSQTTRGTKPSHGSPHVLAGPFVPGLTLSPRGWPCQDHPRVDRVVEPPLTSRRRAKRRGTPNGALHNCAVPGSSFSQQSVASNANRAASRARRTALETTRDR